MQSADPFNAGVLDYEDVSRGYSKLRIPNSATRWPG